MAWMERLIDRYFKIYFTLCLIGFVVAVLLMNIPRVLAASSEAPSSQEYSRFTEAEKPGNAFPNLRERFRVKVSKPKAGEMTGEGRFVEYTGTKLSFVVRF